MPDVGQVKGTLPYVFRKKYPSTYTILDVSEIFIEMPNDLQIQSSTWSNCKHHNTFKFLVVYTPNGAISFVSQLYVGSISDVELTCSSEVIEKLKGKQHIFVMAHRGFNIHDQLKSINVDLNTLPFMDGCAQLPANEVLEGHKITSLRVHVEQGINRINKLTVHYLKTRCS